MLKDLLRVSIRIYPGVRRLSLIVLVALTAIPTARGQVVETEDGIIEFFGLNHWNVGMVQDSMAVHFPNEPLHACAQILKNNFNFAEASVLVFPTPEGTMYRVVTVIEPQNADRVAYSPGIFPGERDVPPNWGEAAGVMQGPDPTLTFGAALRTWRAVLEGDRDGALEQIESWDADSIKAEIVWDVLDRENTPEGFGRALWALQNDGNPANRRLAAALLINFPEYDETWWTLFNAMLDPELEVRDMARTILNDFRLSAAKVVDWTPVASSIHRVLRGTHLFALYVTMDLLTKTEITPDLAEPVLTRGGADLLLDYLGGENDRHKTAAHALLVRLRGEDLGPNPSDWTTWISSLQVNAELHGD